MKFRRFFILSTISNALMNPIKRYSLKFLVIFEIKEYQASISVLFLKRLEALNTNISMKKKLTFFFSILIMGNVFGQKNCIDEFNTDYIDWFNKDLVLDTIMGTSVDKTYSEILKDLTPIKTVVVAVIDAGVDINHNDLEGKIWVNIDEITDNGIK